MTREEIKEAADGYLLTLFEGAIFGAEFRRGDIKAAFEAGVKWKEKQDAKIWKSSRTTLPEGNHQILSYEDDGYFHLGRTVHPDSVAWCFAKELLP